MISSSLLFCLVCTPGLLTVYALHWLERQRVRRRAGEIIQEAALRMVRQVSEALPPAVPAGSSVAAFTPLEREALGINDTDALIQRIDTELRRIA